jgi:amino acid transporter
VAQAEAIVRERSVAHDPRRSLRADSVRFIGTVGSAVGIQAPTAGVTFLPALMAGVVGAAGPVAFGLAIVAMLFVAYAFITFTRDSSSAGSVYAYNGRAMGPAYGFLSVWALIGVYIAYASSVYCSSANILGNLLQASGLTLPWPLLAAGLWLLTIALTYRSIAVSATLIFALEGLSLVLVAVVAVAVIAHGGYQGHGVAATRLLPPGLGLSTLGLGVVFAFTGFSGFEVAATLGEEARQPRRVISLSLVTALLVSGGVYTLMSWVETVGFASATALSQSSVPLVDVARVYISPTMGTAVNVAALISGVGAQLATVNGATRLLFALGRDGVGPRWLARTSATQRSPVGALGVVALVSVAAFLPLSAGSPLDAFFYLSTYGADLIIVVYLLTVIAAFVRSLRRRRPRQLTILLVGVIVMGYVLKSTVYPIPAFPFNYCMYAAGVTLAVGAALLLWPSLRHALHRAPLFAVDVPPHGAGRRA